MYMSYEKIFSSIFDKILAEVNKPYIKNKFEKACLPVIDSLLKKCYPFVFIIISLYMILLILLKIIIIMLIYQKKK